MNKTIQQILENNGFTVTKDTDGYGLQQHTPAGEDWYLHFSDLDEVATYINESFDAEEEFKLWSESSGKNGVPSIPELWKDQLWKKELLDKILIEIKG